MLRIYKEDDPDDELKGWKKNYVLGVYWEMGDKSEDDENLEE